MNFPVNYQDTPFLLTSQTNPHANRLNWRTEILLARNLEAIKGKRVLDLASHDGRFSYAALKLGASHVVGIEARKHLVENARENLSRLGCGPSTYSFELHDMFEYLPKVKQGAFDTILCFGFFYHTVRQVELLREIDRIKPNHFILDTFVEKEPSTFKRKGFISTWAALVSKIRPEHFANLGKSVKKAQNQFETTRREKSGLIFRYEDTGAEGKTIDNLGLVAWPTRSFIEHFFSHCGYQFHELAWKKSEIDDWTQIGDYKSGKRASYIAQLY